MRHATVPLWLAYLIVSHLGAVFPRRARGRQLDGAAIGPHTKHSLERVAAESLWRTRQERSPQQAERPRDTGHLHPMTRPGQPPLTSMEPGQNRPGRGDLGTVDRRSGDSHARGTTGPVIDDQEIIRLYTGDRLTLRQIRERCAVSHARIVRVLDRHHIARRPPGPRSRLAAGDEPAEQQIIDRYLSGLSLRQAGKPFGAGVGTVTGVLDRHGIARRRAGRPRQGAPAAALLAVGHDDRFLRAREVTAMLGVSRRTTYRLIGSGELEAVRVSPRGMRVRASVLRAYLLSHQSPNPGSIDAAWGGSGEPAASRIGQAGPPADVGAPYLQVGPVIVQLTGEITTVGRGANCRIRLNDPSVALLHAEVMCHGLCVSVTAVAGPIGTTTVNGQAVIRHALTEGDVISFGQVTCTVGGLAAHAVPA